MARRCVPNMSDWRVQRFLDWLTTPPQERDFPTQATLAASMEVGYVTMSQWKDDPDFLAEWERRYMRTVGSVERQQDILQALYETATDRSDPRQVTAAKTYLDVIGKARPPGPARGPGSARELTDDQLYEVLAERAAGQLSDG